VTGQHSLATMITQPRREDGQPSGPPFEGQCSFLCAQSVESTAGSSHEPTGFAKGAGQGRYSAGGFEIPLKLGFPLARASKGSCELYSGLPKANARRNSNGRVRKDNTSDS
jgi:hypothetical protein